MYCIFFWDALKYKTALFHVDSSDVVVSQKFSLSLDQTSAADESLRIGLVESANRTLCDADIVGIATVELSPHISSLKCGAASIDLDADVISTDESRVLGFIRIKLKTRNVQLGLKSSPTLSSNVGALNRMQTIFGSPHGGDARRRGL
jgi:hypothetical protein